ncbi:MAG: PTS sugar transporter subunit IIA [Candidatus Fermentibacteraceae bacterium]|nr:PTS sugar transporter subunit IIA [Candidatus Fermentibacteraceae bacterium]MBN2609049.1 PTS sugar transporter subunit IIA [Candidatus Fermentibacteraceae bacterium]
MDISNYLAPESCTIGLEGKNKGEVISSLARLIVNSPAVTGASVEDIERGLMDRESMGSTGFGKGIAIPHCKVDGMAQFILALGVSGRGVDFDAMDGRSVHIFCAIVGPPEEPEMHLRLLAAASRVLGTGNSRYEMLSSKSSYALREAFLYHAAPATTLDSCKDRTFNRLMMVVVQEEDAYNDIIELFLEMGLPGAITHEGNLMGQILSGAPVFAGFLDVLGSSRPEPRTIMALVPADILDDMISSIEEITGDLDNHRGACIIVLAPDIVRGSLETI